MGLINSTDTFNLKGEPVDNNDAAETTGIYESPDGAHHYIKAGKPLPKGWKLRDAVARLNNRPEVQEAQDGIEPKSKKAGGRGRGKKAETGAPENKMDSGPDDNKSDDDIDDYEPDEE